MDGFMGECTVCATGGVKEKIFFEDMASITMVDCYYVPTFSRSVLLRLEANDGIPCEVVRVEPTTSTSLPFKAVCKDCSMYWRSTD